MGPTLVDEVTEGSAKMRAVSIVVERLVITTSRPARGEEQSDLEALLLTEFASQLEGCEVSVLNQPWLGRVLHADRHVENRCNESAETYHNILKALMALSDGLH